MNKHFIHNGELCIDGLPFPFEHQDHEIEILEYGEIDPIFTPAQSLKVRCECGKEFITIKGYTVTVDYYQPTRITRIYISPDLWTCSSGGTISQQEILAMESIGDNASTIKIGNQHINPVKYGLPNNPFLQDYLTMDLLSNPALGLKCGDVAHLYAGPFTNTIRYLKAKGIKIILSIDAHDRDDSIQEFGNLGYDYPYEHVKNNDLWEIYNGGTHEADIVIVPSMASAEFLKREGVENTKLRIIPHGINIPDNWSVTNIPEQFNVGYLGQYGPDKGIKYLIEAWSQLNYQDSTLIFAGTSSKSLGQFINKYATTGKFNLLGYVNDIADFYNNISVYVQPSVTEAFGIEILEAMSYGRPVIASEGAGAADVIDDGINGFIVPKRDPGAIADKIDFLKNRADLFKIGIAARRTAEKYDWSIIRQRYIDVFKSS
jgi:glycosyltransferase involved in cell wall biosynthesis